jgi:hypothetical protein
MFLESLKEQISMKTKNTVAQVSQRIQRKLDGRVRHGVRRQKALKITEVASEEFAGFNKV